MKIVDWLVKLSKPAPGPELKPAPNAASIFKYIELARRLHSIPFKKLFPAVVSVSSVLFFAISGFVAWLVVFLALAVQLFRVFT